MTLACHTREKGVEQRGIKHNFLKRARFRKLKMKIFKKPEGKIEMDRSNWFIEEKAIFGGFPKQEEVEDLEAIGVRYFLDLTRSNERGITPYNTEYSYENYPIFDRSCPIDKISFGKLVVKYGRIINDLPPGEKVYIHCRGGHGRSGLVASCLLAWIKKIPPQEAMEIANRYHFHRMQIREKWRRIGVPQTRVQKNFVLSFFKPVIITKKFEPSLADIFDDVNMLSSHRTIMTRVLEKLDQNQNLIIDLLNTGLGKIIFTGIRNPDERETISVVLGKVRSYFFQACNM